MKKTALLVLLLAACAAPDFRTSFDRAGASVATRDADYNACDYEASRAAAAAQAGADRGSQRTELLVQCMRMKGYQLH